MGVVIGQSRTLASRRRLACGCALEWRNMGDVLPGSSPMPALDSATLAALSAFPDQLEAHYAAFPAGLKHWAPALWEGIPSEHLTAIEQLCHVRDIEVDGYQARF